VYILLSVFGDIIKIKVDFCFHIPYNVFKLVRNTNPKYIMEIKMEQLKVQHGILRMAVSSEGNYISAGQSVSIQTVVDHLKNISVHVISSRAIVRLNLFDTNVNNLLGVK
jgi:hypothetical protein